ncbi:MAG TPA: hypothetical protein VE291_03220 [Terracidiphilus sp.]|jgi:hypothetical protein|nr:hypothetical protein [Terracidiphilus sp.]
MATTVAGLAELLRDVPPGAWVAISEKENRVLTFGVDPQAVLNEAQRQGEKQPLIMRAPDDSSAMFL